jgi:CubicO group peptidase (beta-lactamase class C family)
VATPARELQRARSDSGYFLLGMIIERASAQTYERYLRDAFFRPKGLASTSFSGETAPPPRGYTVSPEGPVTLDSVAERPESDKGPIDCHG